MTIQFSPFDNIGRKRITQLINKTNQFNLTTRRYTEAKIQQLEMSEDTYTLQVRLTDRFGDNGMISVVICKQLSDVWEIDTWLMSCRVIKRGVEESVCNELVEAAKQKGVKLIRGFYRPTEKNTLVQDHYQNLGFKKSESNFAQAVWELAVNPHQPKKSLMKVKHYLSDVSA